MAKLDKALMEFQEIDMLSRTDTCLTRRHPIGKLMITILYLFLVVSFPKYNLPGLAGMSIYLMVLFTIGDLSFLDCIHRIRLILPLVCLIGIWNPFFDRETLLQIGTWSVSGGMISMCTFILKGGFAVIASYLLIATTSMEELCYAFSRLHVPDTLITQFMLTYRYVFLLLQEAKRMTQAYALRAPGQRGIHYKNWGSMVGQLLLRSMDRAEIIYQSMCLRGYGKQSYSAINCSWTYKDVLYLLGWSSVLLLLRFVPVLETIGILLVSVK